ncbi:hypothetical protein FKM82_013016 [Ascaphus truei]
MGSCDVCGFLSAHMTRDIYTDVRYRHTLPRYLGEQRVAGAEVSVVQLRRLPALTLCFINGPWGAPFKASDPTINPHWS